MNGSGSESDFDEDPDKIEVPGGGKNLLSLVTTPSIASIAVGTPLKLKTSLGQNIIINPANLVGSLQSLLRNQQYQLTLPQVQLVKNNLPAQSSIQVQNYPLILASSLSTINNEVDNEEEGMGVAETYANYMPTKLKIGLPHPDPVVESTSLSSVEPVDVWYKLMLPNEVLSTGALSALQLESITYACQQHEKKLPDGSRAGFLIGDGAGVGKGRTIAGIIYENYLRGRKKSVWVSIMSDLKVDAERDLADIGASIRVYSLSKSKYTKLTNSENGNIKKGVIFCTYSAIIAKTTQSGSEFDTRLEQLVNWCGKNFDGLIVFDECHKAKNLNFSVAGRSTKTGQVVLELQKILPNARIVYASATGATEPKNMAYMVRLGIWGKGTPYKDFSEFFTILQRRGVGAMEIVAMDMKLRGLYIARQLSFHGVQFKVIEVGMNDKFKKVYDESTHFWAEAYCKFRDAFEILKMEKSAITITWTQFWSAHQRFFKYMCISAKVKEAVYLSREAIKCGKCVVIGLQSTGEARTLEYLDRDGGELTDFVSTAHGVLITLIEKYFPTPPKKFNVSSHKEENFCTSKRKHKEKPRKKRRKVIWDITLSDDSATDTESSNDEVEQFQTHSFDNLDGSKFHYIHAFKNDLLKKVDKLGKKLPPNALDELIDELGGPDNVAEMTGRKGRIIHNDGNFKYTSRSETEASLEMMNLMEKQRFMNGEKDVAIISEAASSGISLHSDRRAINRKCRVHITLELPWSADKAIQQFGRTHRSNQTNAPEYILLISDLGGERRFASVVAKRLESLGALTHGDRRATEAQDFSKFNIDNNYGRTAVDITIKSFLNKNNERLVSPPAWYKGDFMKDAQEGLLKVGLLTPLQGEPIIEADKKSLGKFLNRILGLPVDLQNAIFQYFTDTMAAVIDKAKKAGHFDLGILDVATSDQILTKISVHKFVRPHATGVAASELYKVSAERGMSWKEAEALWRRAQSHSKFYISPFRNGKREVLLAVREESCGKNDESSYTIYRPNLGRQVKKEALALISRKYSEGNINEAQEHWEMRYMASSEICSHKYWGGVCKQSWLGELCDVGLRRKMYYILSGSVLSVWNIIEEIISRVNRLQVVRVKTTDGGKIVGTLVPSSCVEALISSLSIGAEKVVKRDF